MTTTMRLRQEVSEFKDKSVLHKKKKKPFLIYIKNSNMGRSRWLMSMILALGRLRQGGSRPAVAI